MNRRDFLRTSALFAGSVPMLSRAAEKTPAVPADLAPGTPGMEPGIPTVTNPSQDAVSILWGVARPSTGHLEYGDTPELGKTEAGMIDGLLPYDDKVIAIRLRGLTPGAKVFYRTVT